MVESRGKQAVLARALGSGLGAIGSPGPKVVKDPSILDQACPRPQGRPWAGVCGESEQVSLGERQAEPGVRGICADVESNTQG